jgi:hypothetical protein
VDWVIVIALSVSFAAFVTVHVALSVSLLLFEKPHWRGLAALVLPPLAPAFGFMAKKTRLSIVWIVLLGLYAAARIAAWLAS